MPATRRASARVTTRTGDGGETSLFGKDRVRKTDPRITALGDLDEAQSAIGVARSLAARSTLGRELLELQRGLYVAMSEVATPREDLARLPQRIDPAAVERLDRMLESLKKNVRIEGRFVIPGETRIAAAVDLARAVTRRAERSVVACVDAGTVAAERALSRLYAPDDCNVAITDSLDSARLSSSGVTVRVTDDCPAGIVTRVGKLE